MARGVNVGKGELHRLRAPDAAQRVALAKRCAAEPGPSRTLALGTVPALRSGMKNAAPRPGHDYNLTLPVCGLIAAPMINAATILIARRRRTLAVRAVSRV